MENSKKIVWRALLTERRFYVILLLGFASGLPLALTASLLEARFATANMSLTTIGWVGLVGLPYVFKFLWAPLLDRYTLPWLGRGRGWMLLSQIILCILIVLLGCWDVQVHPLLIAGLTFILAFFSATQDIAIDAYRTNILTSHEWGLGASLASGSYRVGMLVSGAFGFILADHLGWRDTYFFIAGCLGIGIIGTLWAQNPPHERQEIPHSLRDSIVLPFKTFFQHKGAMGLLLILIFYKFGDAFALKLSTTFLLRGVGASMTEVGTINKLFGFASVLLGMFVAGFCMLRMRLFTALWFFGILQAITNLLFVALAIVGYHLPLMTGTIIAENFTSGMGSAALTAFLMSLCDRRYTAFQFALFSSLIAIPREIVSPITGYVAHYFDWPVFFTVSFVISLPVLLLIWYLKEPILAVDDPMRLNARR